MVLMEDVVSRAMFVELLWEELQSLLASKETRTHYIPPIFSKHESAIASSTAHPSKGSRAG